jgi:membrane protease YdiL (CAAX protease family)
MNQNPLMNSATKRPVERRVLERSIPIIEVGVVLVLFNGLRLALRGTPFAAWQGEAFGGAPLTSALLFFALPIAVLLIGRKNPGRYGLTTRALPYHQRVGLRAAGVLLPVALLFPAIGLLGSTHEKWPGALLLTIGVTVATVLAVRRTASLDTREPLAISAAGTGAYLLMLIFGLLTCFAFNQVSGIAARAVQMLIFVGFLEEFFFRGYLQSRLNDAFGRPYRVAGVAIGPGLFVGAAIFGLLHPLTSPGGIPWPWALWTAGGGLLFGFLREKSGSVVAPAVAHGLFVLPTAFWSP